LATKNKNLAAIGKTQVAKISKTRTARSGCDPQQYPMINGIANELRALAQRLAHLACEWSD